MNKMNKKGAYGIEIATGVIMSIFVLVLIMIAVFVGIATLNSSTILPAGSAEKNASLSLTGNLSTAAAQFGGMFPTFLGIIAVVIIMTFLGLMIYVVTRFAKGSGEKGL